MRDQGICYTQQAYALQMKHSTIVALDFRIKNAPGRKDEIVQSLFSDIKKEVLSKITEKDLEDLHERTQLSFKANPITIETRFAAAREGLHDNDMIIDADKMRTIAKSVSVDDYKKWLNRLTTTLPATILAGNVKDKE